MKQWTISPGSVVLLLGVLSVIVVVLVLPQVDLLDTAFHLGTAPLAVHSHVNAKPAFAILSALVACLLLPAGHTAHHGMHRWIPTRAYRVQVLNHEFRC